MENRDKAVDEMARQMESDLELLGVTGIEDKLQEGVPEAIAALRSASIPHYLSLYRYSLIFRRY